MIKNNNDYKKSKNKTIKMNKKVNKTIKHKRKDNKIYIKKSIDSYMDNSTDSSMDSSINKSKSISNKKIMFNYISPKSKENFDMNNYFTDSSELYKMMNKKYSTFEELFKYQRIIKKNKIFSEKENLWAEEYLQPIIDFFGDYVFIIQIFGVLRDDNYIYENIQDEDLIASFSNFIIGTRQIHFAGRGHWYANNGNAIKWIDPYEVGVQIKGTNQFCQTYAQMIMANEIDLPVKQNHNNLDIYYKYTKKALLWQKKHLDLFNKNIHGLLKIYEIKTNVLFTPSKEQIVIMNLINRFNEIYHKHDILMKMPYACLNVVNIETSLI